MVTSALPSVSVIVPAYNAERTLAGTLDSVAAQTHVPEEVIVVDDGSSDRTVEIARSYVDRLPGLRVVSIANGGVGVARNVGIRLSRCEVIAPLDADDIWHPAYLQRMLQRYAESGPATGFVYCLFRRIDMADTVLHCAAYYPVDGGGFYQLLLHNYVGSGSNAIFSRRRAAAVGLYDERYRTNEDFLMQLALAWRGRVVAVPEYLVGYRNTPGSLSKNLARMADDHFRLLDEIPDLFEGVDEDVLRWSRARMHAYCFEVLVLNPSLATISAPYHFAMAFIFDPASKLRRLPSLAAAVIRRLVRWSPASSPVPFLDLDPTEAPHLPRYLSPRLPRAISLDAARTFADLAPPASVHLGEFSGDRAPPVP